MYAYRLFMPIFELLTVLVLIGLFTGYFSLNKRRGDALRPLPFKTVLVSMLSFALSALLIGIYNSIYLSGYRITTQSTLVELISLGFMLIAVNLLFHSFFAMIHVYGEQILGQSNLWPRVRIVHWVLLSLFMALSILDWCWSLYQRVSYIKSTHPNFMKDPYWIWTQIVSARWIIFWVGSWEILGAFIVMGIQMSTTRKSHTSIRMSTFFAIISGSLFFGLNGLWAVWSINSYLASAVAPTEIAIAVREIIQFFFATDTYLGLGLCFWRFPLQVAIDHEDDSTTKFTSNLRSGPVEANSRRVIAEADTSRQILEADASRPILEADGTNPILEADSTGNRSSL